MEDLGVSKAAVVNAASRFCGQEACVELRRRAVSSSTDSTAASNTTASAHTAHALRLRLLPEGSPALLGVASVLQPAEGK